jgi:hypothetical protein
MALGTGPKPVWRINAAGCNPYKTFRWHLGMINVWCLHSRLTWDRLCRSCVGSFFPPYGAFLEQGAYAISRRLRDGSPEALRGAQPEVVGLARSIKEYEKHVLGATVGEFCVIGACVDRPGP